jgi:hypothetical protein
VDSNQIEYLVGNYPASVNAIDVNDDNKANIIVANYNAGTIAVFTVC